MYVYLVTQGFNTMLPSTTQVRVMLTNGGAQVLDGHQDLLGQIENNVVEFETNVENKIEKVAYVIQQGIFMVSVKGLDYLTEDVSQHDLGTGETTVYVYAKQCVQLLKNMSTENLVKQYENGKAALERESYALSLVSPDSDDKHDKVLRLILTSRVYQLADDVSFFEKTIEFANKLKT
jgi:F0F1-type ATP synthase epsilon subunit